MAEGRRGFLRSIAVGGAACLAGCGAPAVPDADAGARQCRDPEPRPHPVPDLDYPGAAYFDGVAADLDEAGIGTPAVFLDLDRVDANIDAIARGTPAGGWRIVEKSLPSLDLLAYVAATAGERFLVLHLPFLRDLLARFPSADVLMGKTQLTSAVRTFFDSLPAADVPDVASRVVFLADDRARLDELIALGATLGAPLRVAVEIDVGLRRSGVSQPSELPAVLDALAGTSDAVFAGLLGYDGHVAFTPGGAAGIDDAWQDASAEYQAFVDVLAEQYPALAARPDLIFHSGGSATYPMYGGGDTPVNDVAAGGGVLRPGGYPNHVIGDLAPAIFIATPVLRRYEAPILPFLNASATQRLIGERQGLTIYGGGWPAFFTHPADIQPMPLVSDPTDAVMVPNQGMVSAPAGLEIAPGDWVFYHPRQSDALFQFETIHLVRGGRLQSETMAPYPRRY